MRVRFFILMILFLYLLETSFIPGLLTQEPLFPLSLLLFLTCMYYAWAPWMIAFLIYILILPFFFTSHAFLLCALFSIYIIISFILTQYIFGSRTITGFLIYAISMSLLISASYTFFFKLSSLSIISYTLIFTLAFLCMQFMLPVHRQTRISLT